MSIRVIRGSQNDFARKRVERREPSVERLLTIYPLPVTFPTALMILPNKAVFDLRLAMGQLVTSSGQLVAGERQTVPAVSFYPASGHRLPLQLNPFR